MKKQPENSPNRPNFFLQMVQRYGQYVYLPGGPVAPQPQTNGDQTITFWERLDLTGEMGLSESEGEAWHLRRIEPAEPIDFLEYYRRKN